MRGGGDLDPYEDDEENLQREEQDFRVGNTDAVPEPDEDLGPGYWFDVIVHAVPDDDDEDT